ncbi:cytochrome c biogenesis protein CcdA [Apibacter raozihei]|uniref:protein-disulfide reductase DsbD family protein n=1 Tax=Apibacter raozihei TaxID=2500547 RepID=UPI000FE352FE|nr:cytochrome c biogenesis protein CcdA [Apibacter raozihei]
MKKLFWLLVLITAFAHSQIKTPVKWKAEIIPVKDNLYEAIFTATLEPGWHVYSKETKVENAIPTALTYPKSNNIKLIGSTKEVGKKIEEYSEVFEGTLVYYSNKVEYHQKFEVLGDKPVHFEADVEFQICNDKVCLAPDGESFSLEVSPQKRNTEEQKEENNENPALELSEKKLTKDSLLTSNNGSKLEKENTIISKNQILIPSLDRKNPINKECGEKIIQDESNGWIFIFGFIGGLIALLTPCVYPMIPLTISYFTKQAKSKNQGRKDALLYAFFILLIFLLFTLPFHLISGINPDIFNQISTNVWLNLIFFIIFIIFAFSFFGYYDITLPSWMANKSDKASESGGFIGLFFMALTLVIVSFSCTGPVLGSILANAIQNPTQLTLAFGGCGLAWAMVFGGFALFPQFLHNMPKSGGWMNTIKVVLGFMELALALKFLSKADLVAKTFLLKREIFIALWIIIAIAIVLYLLGVIRFPHDSKKIKIGTGRKIFALIFAVVALYMIPGVFPSEKPNLKLLSGITPPLNVSIYKNKQDKGVLGLRIIHDYYEAIEIAKKENKPVLIDFTGYGCENCRKMEEFVWSEPDVWQLLNDKVVIASLYVDDSEYLPENEQQTIQLKEGRKRKIRTIGNKWSTFQRENFSSNSQPFYVLVTPDSKILNEPVAGYMDKEDFKQFLNCGINTYKELKKP